MNDRFRRVLDATLFGLAGGPGFDDRLGRWSAWFRFRLAVEVVSMIVVAVALPTLLAG